MDNPVRVKLIACVGMVNNYSFEDEDGNYRNIVDHPLVPKHIKDLDRALFRNFLRQNEGAIVTCGPVVADDMGKLFKTFNLRVAKFDSNIAEIYTTALNEQRNILVLGGKRTYDMWIESNLVDEAIIHQLPIFPTSKDKHHKSFINGYFQDKLVWSGDFSGSSILTYKR